MQELLFAPHRGNTMSASQYELLEALAKASSQSPSVLKEAEAQLKSWESERGFYRALTGIFTNCSFELRLRWIAVLYFKNGVDRYWRKTAPNAIPEDEKEQIREALLDSLPEPVPQIAIQKAVVISKIARFDCPREWTALYPTLLAIVRNASAENALAKTRALEILALTTKTLASKRLAVDRRLFQEIASEIFLPVAQELDSTLGRYYEELRHGEPRPHLERARFCLKILRYVCVHGFPAGSNHFAPVNMFLSSVFSEARKFFDAGSIDDANWEKFLVLLTKIPADVLELKPFVFVPFLSDALEFCWHFTCVETNRVPKKLIVQSFNLMKAILLCMEYKMSSSASQSASASEWELVRQGVDALKLRNEFFSKSRVHSLTTKLIGTYFLLTREELDLWVSDPEGYARDDAGETSKYSLRACVECFFTALTHEFFETVGETIMGIYRDQSLYIPADPNDLQSILVADAVYCALGLAAFNLFDELDFNHMLTTTLIRQLKVDHPNYKIVKNRIIWLIGRWIVVRIKFELRPLLYEELLPYIGGTGCDDEGEVPDADLVLRLQAANTLKLAVDDFEFSVEQFLPYLEPTFLRLFCLLQEVQECDTKLRVLHVMSFVVERVGVHIKPFLSGLVDYLPRLWNEAVDHQMLKASIVATLVHIVDSIGRDSGSLYSFLLAIVQASTDSNSPDHVYLLEDGLDLWHAVVKNAPEPNADLATLYERNMPGLLELGGESLKVCFKIIMAYIYLNPEEFVRAQGQSLSACFLRMVNELKREGALALVRLTELAIRALPQEAPVTMRPFVEWILNHALAETEFSTSPMLTSSEFAILSRIILFLPDLIRDLVQGLAAAANDRALRGDTALRYIVSQGTDAPNAGVDPSMVWARLLDLWTMKFSTFVAPAKRKVMAAAMASMFPSADRVILDRFCGILLCICETLNDISESEDLSGYMDSLAINEDASEAPFPDIENPWNQGETAQDERKRDFGRRDPAHQLPLKEYVQAQINALKDNIGPDNFQVLLTSVDCETMRNAREYFTL